MPRWTLIDKFSARPPANHVEALDGLFETYPLLVTALDHSGWIALASACGREATT